MSQEKVAVISGASSGIGAATAKIFGITGFRVVLAARRFGRLEALREEIHALGGKALAVKTDVTNLEDIYNLVDTTIDHWGQIDILINNAGFGRLRWLENLDPVHDIDTQFNVNVLGTVQLTRAILPNMIERQSGHIINISSLAGLIAAPTYSIYASSKFAVRGFTQALSREVKMWGIHVSGIYPGTVKSEFSLHTGSQRKSGSLTPRRLVLSPEDVAQTILRTVGRPRRMVILPWVMWFLVWTNALFPSAIDWMIYRKFMVNERKHT